MRYNTINVCGPVVALVRQVTSKSGGGPPVDWLGRVAKRMTTKLIKLGGGDRP